MRTNHPAVRARGCSVTFFRYCSDIMTVFLLKSLELVAGGCHHVCKLFLLKIDAIDVGEYT